MVEYTNIKVNITDRQKQLIQNALQEDKPVGIRFTYEDLNGNDVLALTKSQVNKIKKAYENGKGVTIKLSKKQVMHNKKVEGGFLATLIPLAMAAAKAALPALGIGALSGLANEGVKKILHPKKGKGLFLVKGGNICQIETVGQGLYLGPPSIKFKPTGDGLYLHPSSRAAARQIQPAQYSGMGLPFLNVLL